MTKTISWFAATLMFPSLPRSPDAVREAGACYHRAVVASWNCELAQGGASCGCAGWDAEAGGWRTFTGRCLVRPVAGTGLDGTEMQAEVTIPDTSRHRWAVLSTLAEASQEAHRGELSCIWWAADKAAGLALGRPISLEGQTVEALAEIRTSINGELARRTGDGVCVRVGDWRQEAPKGGALLKNRPAIGGDYDTDDWFPTLDAANAALRARFPNYPVFTRDNGTLSVDYTAPGCTDAPAPGVSAPTPTRTRPQSVAWTSLLTSTSPTWASNLKIG